jgi:hypothetical protein
MRASQAPTFNSAAVPTNPFIGTKNDPAQLTYRLPGTRRNTASFPRTNVDVNVNVVVNGS